MDDPIILDCDKCGANTVFGPDGLKGSDRIICAACNVDYGFVAELRAIKEAIQSRFGGDFEDGEGIKFFKDDI